MVMALVRHPLLFARELHRVAPGFQADRFTRRYPTQSAGSSLLASEMWLNAPRLEDNPLWVYFMQHKQGQGIHKWKHYFPIYHRHFAPFIGRQVNILEVGIHSGGSLEMWLSYFGEKSHIFGVDVEPACEAYQNERVSVFVGDQEDRSLWRTVKESVPGIDIFIDDGGHTPEQQKVTLEEMLPHLRPGGVYVCEDIHGSLNRFSAFAAGLVHDLNSIHWNSASCSDSSVSRFQSAICSIHFYPYVVVIEKHIEPLSELSSLRQGTSWQPW